MMTRYTKYYRKGQLLVGPVIHILIVVSAVLIIALIIFTFVASGQTEVDDSTKPKNYNLAEADCLIKCPQIAYPRNADSYLDSDVCTSNVKDENKANIEIACKNLPSGTGSGTSTPSGPPKAILSGKFKPCSEMTIKFNNVDFTIIGLEMKICKDLETPTTCLADITDTTSDPPVDITADGDNSFTLCPNPGCAPADNTITAKFRLPCDNTLLPDISYTIKIEEDPNEKYGEKTRDYKWSCPKITLPEGILPGQEMPVTFSDEISLPSGTMEAKLEILEGCFDRSDGDAFGATYLHACPKPPDAGCCKSGSNDLTHVSDNIYKINMPWVNFGVENSIVFHILLGTHEICRTGKEFTWSCPSMQCKQEGTKQYIYKELDESGSEKPNPPCRYNIKDECPPTGCVADPEDYIPGNCKFKETKLEVAEIYLVSKYVYKCSSKDTDYKFDSNGRYICKFDNTHVIAWSGAIENIHSGTYKCSGDAESNYHLDPAGDAECKCNNKGEIDFNGNTANCPSYIRWGASTTALPGGEYYYHAEIKNTGDLPVKIADITVSAKFDDVDVGPGAFTKKLDADGIIISIDTHLNEGETLIYEFRKIMSITQSDTHTIDIDVEYKDVEDNTGNVYGNQDIYMFPLCCNDCTCSDRIKCKSCMYCIYTEFGDCDLK